MLTIRNCFWTYRQLQNCEVQSGTLCYADTICFPISLSGFLIFFSPSQWDSEQRNGERCLKIETHRFWHILLHTETELEQGCSGCTHLGIWKLGSGEGREQRQRGANVKVRKAGGNRDRRNSDTESGKFSCHVMSGWEERRKGDGVDGVWK